MRGGLSRLESRLGYVFRDRSVLVRALTHSSHAHESGGGPDNEPLEFLGDSALGFLVAQALVRRFTATDVGGLSKFKAFLVSRSNLAAVARRIGLGEHLILGRAAEKEQGRNNDSILADGLEAVIAAVLIDGGDDPTRALVGRLFGRQMARLRREEVEEKDYKTALQELLQARGRPAPRYRVARAEGPPHNPVFHVSVLVEGSEVARARGRSKKEAEQKAARLAVRLTRGSGA
ncbi:MAG: ribonuclease III [Acidobacteria bacterium]|nr:ribonuclease III [Acidobacteriota bacterium]